MVWDGEGGWSCHIGIITKIVFENQQITIVSRTVVQ